MKIAIIGAGSWGTALSNLLANKGLEVSLWVREPQLYEELIKKRENTWFLPGIKLSKNINFSLNLCETVKHTKHILIAVPSQFVRDVLKRLRPHLDQRPVIICASKGIEILSLKPMSSVVYEELKDKMPIYAILSGPSFAKEVAQNLPTAVTIGCEDAETAKELQEMFFTPNFRVYTNKDYIGVELGGAIKNVIAIAAGICDGLGLGTNARAALITRGLAEMSRLGKAMGADERTFMGLSGLGDLVLTCTGELSRNRQLGLKIAKGEDLNTILKNTKMVAEGVSTTKALYLLGRQKNIELPITEQVYKVLYEKKDPKEATKELMTRTLKEEFY